MEYVKGKTSDTGVEFDTLGVEFIGNNGKIYRDSLVNVENDYDLALQRVKRGMASFPNDYVLAQIVASYFDEEGHCDIFLLARYNQEQAARL